MILQELVKYYERKLEEGAMAPEGFEYKEIPYLIEIDEEGNFVRFISTWKDEKKKRSRMFLVPKGLKRASGVDANLLWDNAAYILGIPDNDKLEESKKKGKGKKYLLRLEEQRKSFLSKIEQLSETIELRAIKKFLSVTNFEQLEKDPLWNEIKNSNPNATFKIKDHQEIISERKNVINSISNPENKNPESQYMCLITGEVSEIERLHPNIQGVWNANTSGASITAFEQVCSRSYEKEQGANAPVSKYAAFAYGTSLNTLLSRDSHQKIQIGDASTVYWSEKKSDMEELFGGLFETSEKDRKDKEKQDIVQTKEHFVSPFSGKFRKLLQEETKFFILGLSPNAARISIRFWYPTTVGEVSRNIEQHFQDLKVAIPNYESGFLSLYRILCSTAVQGKYDNVNPLLAGKIMTSILNGSEYPRMLLSALLIRIKAEQRINFERASLIKAILNRKGRLDENFRNEYKFKEFKTIMDESNTNVAYRLGRLFAVMEKLQQSAIGGNKTIKDGYFASASTRPASVFARLFTLSNHHASKLGNKGTWYEKMKGEIIAPLKANIPKTFKLEEQGMFAIGYYQQREELFKKKEDKQVNEGEQK